MKPPLQFQYYDFLPAKNTSYVLSKTLFLFHSTTPVEDFPGGAVAKNLPANAGDAGDLIPGSGRSPGEGNGNPLQFSCLENSMHRGAWWATVHGVEKGRTRLSTHTQTHTTVVHKDTQQDIYWKEEVQQT